MASTAIPVSRPKKKTLKLDAATIGLGILALVILVLLVGYMALLKPIGKVGSTVPQQTTLQQSLEPSVPGAGLPTAQPTQDADDDKY